MRKKINKELAALLADTSNGGLTTADVLEAYGLGINLETIQEAVRLSNIMPEPLLDSDSWFDINSAEIIGGEDDGSSLVIPQIYRTSYGAYVKQVLEVDDTGGLKSVKPIGYKEITEEEVKYLLNCKDLSTNEFKPENEI